MYNWFWGLNPKFVRYFYENVEYRLTANSRDHLSFLALEAMSHNSSFTAALQKQLS